MSFAQHSNFKWTSRINVEAAQWTGDNLNEMKILLMPYVDNNEWDGPEVYLEEIEPYFLPSIQKHGGGYNMLKFYAGDDMEVDPGQWVVIYEDREIEIMNDEQFHKMFGRSNMGYLSSAKGYISVTPGILEQQVEETPYCRHGDTTLEVTGVVSPINPNLVNPSLIIPRYDDKFKAYDTIEELNGIVDRWGEGRVFSGYIEIQGEGDGIGDIDLYRLAVKDGKVVEITPKLVWPED